MKFVFFPDETPPIWEQNSFFTSLLGAQAARLKKRNQRCAFSSFENHGFGRGGCFSRPPPFPPSCGIGSAPRQTKKIGKAPAQADSVAEPAPSSIDSRNRRIASLQGSAQNGEHIIAVQCFETAELAKRHRFIGHQLQVFLADAIVRKPRRRPKA